MWQSNCPAAEIPPSITTPDKVETRIGTLDFKDGAPSKATLDKVYDNLDFTHAFEAFVNTFQGVNVAAARKGFLDIGVKDNEILIFSELMDAKSLFLTANADTVYFVGFIDLTKGPMVFETPPKALGTLDDMWWRWVIDFGLPGPDRGEGGKYLLLPPGYDGPVPEGGFFVARPRTTRVADPRPLFLENKNDPKPAVELIKKFTKIYPYEAGGVGTSIAEFLDGKTKLGRITPPPADRVPRRQRQGDEHHSAERLQLLRDAQRGRAAGTGHLARPRTDGTARRHRHRQGQAVRARCADEEDPDRSARARQRHLAQPVHESARSELVLLSRLGVDELLFVSGYEFETPIPMITREGVKPFPPTGYRTLDARTAFFYGVTGITPAMAMRLPGIGSQYLFASWMPTRTTSTAPRPTR